MSYQHGCAIFEHGGWSQVNPRHEFLATVHRLVVELARVAETARITRRLRQEPYMSLIRLH
jgi:hypothetical protein